MHLAFPPQARAMHKEYGHPHDTTHVPQVPFINLDKSAVAAVYAPTYAKKNGCPVASTADNLSCKDCLLSSSKQQSGALDNCASTITAGGVSVGVSQFGRVSWVDTVTDQAERQVSKDCSICVDHGSADVIKCPRPYTFNTPCDAGHL